MRGLKQQNEGDAEGEAHLVSRARPRCLKAICMHRDDLEKTRLQYPQRVPWHLGEVKLLQRRTHPANPFPQRPRESEIALYHCHEGIHGGGILFGSTYNGQLIYKANCQSLTAHLSTDKYILIEITLICPCKCMESQQKWHGRLEKVFAEIIQNCQAFEEAREGPLRGVNHHGHNVTKVHPGSRKWMFTGHGTYIKVAQGIQLLLCLGRFDYGKLVVGMPTRWVSNPGPRVVG